MFGILSLLVIVCAIIYNVGNFFFHIGADFSIAIMAFWAGFVLTMKERGEPIVKNADIYSNVCFGLSAVFFIRGFFR